MVSKCVMRTQLIAVVCFGLLVSPAAFGRQKADKGVKIRCPLGQPLPVKIIRPTYPVLAEQTHVEGTVSLKCLVGRDGSIVKIEVKKGHPLLIQASTDAVSQWKFKPLVINGKSVETEAIVNIDFKLPKQPKK